MENRKLEKMNKNKCRFFKKIVKEDKPITMRLKKKKKPEKTQINKNHKGKWEITTSSTEIKGIIK